jgi:hypothetical protein
MLPGFKTTVLKNSASEKPQQRSLMRAIVRRSIPAFRWSTAGMCETTQRRTTQRLSFRLFR